MTEIPAGTRYIVWVNYHTEGWRPEFFAGQNELEVFYLGGCSHGAETILTGPPLGLRVRE